MSSMNDSIRIRPMTAEDVERVIEVAESLKLAPQWKRGAYLTALNSEAALRRIALAADDSTTGVVGFAVASLTPPESELETIGIIAEFQRRGVARRLFDEVTKALRLAQVQTIGLEVRASNEAARAFYDSLGFAESSRRPRYYADPVEDAVLMCLKIN